MHQLPRCSWLIKPTWFIHPLQTVRLRKASYGSSSRNGVAHTLSVGDLHGLVSVSGALMQDQAKR